jgi:hypothetical protein
MIASTVHVTNLTPPGVTTLVGSMVKRPIDDSQTPPIDDSRELRKIRGCLIRCLRRAASSGFSKQPKC